MDGVREAMRIRVMILLQRTKHEKQTYILASNNHYHLKTSVHLQVTLILKMTEKEAEK